MFSICVSEKEAQLDELHETTSDLEELLQQSGIPTQKKAGTQSPDMKGDPITIGTILIGLLTPHLAIELVKAIQQIMTRKRSVSIEITGSNGRKLSYSVDDAASTETDKILQELKPFWSSELTVTK